MKDLLQPRFIVTNDYPYSNLNVGDIFTPMNGNSHIEYADNGEKIEINFSDYPHLFRPLHWSEFLKDEDKPKYVKNNLEGAFCFGEIYKVHKHNNKGVIIKDSTSFNNELYLKYTTLLPATETEYNNFINQEK